jgi:protein O-mannosyl-transferase
VQRARNIKYFLAASVAVATLLVYIRSLLNDFVNWDDGPYVITNLHIRSFDAAFFRWAFFDFYKFNWHPLTWISHALDYAFWGLNPLGHHLTNIILHAINTSLVVVLALKLLEIVRERSDPHMPASFLNDRTVLIAAGVTGLLFGLHPVHVESVAWVAERKDLLCALFFLLSIMSYVRYADDVSDKSHRAERKGSTPCTMRFAFFTNKHYLLTLGFFVLALMSKPMAVSLPVVLLILDWYPFVRIRSWKTLWSTGIEKLPLLALSLLSSVVTILAQRSGGAMELMDVVPLSTRLLVAAHSLILYLWKMVWPLGLMPFYPYPRNVTFVSLEYFAAIAVVAGITVTCIVLAKNKKVWLSVWSYYIVTLIPVLGIVQVGAQSMADRYTYLPSLGPFLIMGLVSAWVWEKVKIRRKRGVSAKTSATVIAFFMVVSLCYLTFQQIGLWKNDIDLWQSVIEKEHQKVLFAYFKRGQAFALREQYEKAIEDYTTVIASNYEEYSKVYIERGFVYLKAGQADLAVKDLQKACALGDNFGCKSLRYIVK